MNGVSVTFMKEHFPRSKINLDKKQTFCCTIHNFPVLSWQIIVNGHHSFLNHFYPHPTWITHDNYLQDLHAHLPSLLELYLLQLRSSSDYRLLMGLTSCFRRCPVLKWSFSHALVTGSFVRFDITGWNGMRFFACTVVGRYTYDVCFMSDNLDSVTDSVDKMLMHPALDAAVV